MLCCPLLAPRPDTAPAQVRIATGAYGRPATGSPDVFALCNPQMASRMAIPLLVRLLLLISFMPARLADPIRGVGDNLAGPQQGVCVAPGTRKNRRRACPSRLRPAGCAPQHEGRWGCRSLASIGGGCGRREVLEEVAAAPKGSEGGHASSRVIQGAVWRRVLRGSGLWSARLGMSDVGGCRARDCSGGGGCCGFRRVEGCRGAWSVGGGRGRSGTPRISRAAWEASS